MQTGGGAARRALPAKSQDSEMPGGFDGCPVSLNAVSAKSFHHWPICSPACASELTIESGWALPKRALAFSRSPETPQMPARIFTSGTWSRTRWHNDEACANAKGGNAEMQITS